MVDDHGQHTIFIPHSDLALLQQIVLPNMLPSLLYKNSPLICSPIALAYLSKMAGIKTQIFIFIFHLY